jgi:hypothetical protein
VIDRAVRGGRGLIGVFSVAVVVGLAVSDGPPASLSGFWSQHAMLTNLVSSAAFAVLTVTVIEAWLHRREEQRAAAVEQAEQQRLTVVRSAAYNAVARAPIAQRRIMWFLVHGGELRRVPEFEIPEIHAGRLRAILARLGLEETSEDDVMHGLVPAPDFAGRFPALTQDEQWRQVVHDVLLDAVHGFRVLVARWSSLLLTTEESLGALKDLAGQAEEFSRVFVEFAARRPASDYRDERLRHRQRLWTRAFANAVALEEALIDKGGERGTSGGHFHTPGRLLLLPDDLAALEQRRPGADAATSSLRLYPEDPPDPPGLT